MKTTTSSPTAAAKPRALIVPAEVLALEGITLTAKLILAEVIDLYKVKKHVFASDEHFAARLGIGLRTVGDAIKQLHEHSLLDRTIDPKARHKRQLTPTLPSTPTAKSLQNPQANVSQVAADSAAGACENRYVSLRNLPEVPAKSAGVNTRVNSKANIHVTPTGGVAAEAAAHAQNEQGLEDWDDASPLMTVPSSPLVAAVPPSSRPRTARAKPKSASQHAFAESPYADADAFIEALQGTDYAHADLRYYHEVIRTWAESKDARNANWLPMMCNWMLRDAKDQKLKTTSSSLASSSHAYASASTHAKRSHHHESLADVGAAVDQYFETKYGR
ncbi:helix-turn-helix domain-containing protein [Hymenobacter aquaticus]|uniref:Helix-turn-helix domain-containing protein n=1 Tax=Hymenobacter aquaticus TaxID=1867101 RepID=A0A4Z0Q6A5_9BACT|nr:helix-turn-helix domain-containing protein [Hymenobacter aquaticus]TGE25184.1 helix-turn-helix domain-containing protein [Hymenobacter aquaticus]